MKTKIASTPLLFARSLAMGVLLSMLLFYSAHVLGKWTVEKYRPYPEITYTIQLYNKCSMIGTRHILRPNTDISGLGDGINGTKLSGSFMNFSDGHILTMIGLAVLSGSMIFFIRNMKKQKSTLNL